MDELIKQVQAYFTLALSRGDYNLSDPHPGYITATVDEKYKFTIWYGSGEPRYISIWNNGFIQLPPFTLEQQEAIWQDIQVYLSIKREVMREDRLNELRAEINRLEAERE